MYEIFRGEVAKEQQIRKLSHKDLAKMIGVSANTMRAFMCGARVSENIAKKLSAVLGIPL